MESTRCAFIANCEQAGEDAPAAILERLMQPPHSTSSSGKGGGQRLSETLDLSGRTCSVKILSALANALQTDVLYTSVCLADSFLGDDGAIVIAGALKVNNTIKTLDLRGNNIRADGATALAQMLKVNTSLSSLVLEWNCVGIWETGIKALGDVLPINHTLEHLDLRNCKIGPHGAQALAQGLKGNTSLKRLDLRWNNVGIVGARAFVTALKLNMVLSELNLTGNDIPEDAGRAIEVSLERNRSRLNLSEQTKAHSHHLTTTLQTLSSAHQAAIDEISSKLYATDSRASGLNDKLNSALRDLESANGSLRRSEARCKELEDELKMNTKAVAEFQRELILEREDDKIHQKRVKYEDQQSSNMSALQSRALEMEASLREAEMKVEVLRRDKVLLLDEVEKAKERERSLSELHKERLTRLEANHQSKMLDALEKKDEEMMDRCRKFEERLRTSALEKQKCEEAYDELKVKALAEKRHMIDKISEAEDRVHKEEEARRKDLETQLEHLRLTHATVVAEFASLTAQSKALAKDHATEIKRLNETNTSLTETHHELKTLHSRTVADNESLRNRVDEMSRVERGLKDSVDGLQGEVRHLRETLGRESAAVKAAEERAATVIGQKDALITRLKDEIRRLERELKDEHDNQTVRFSELASQINSLLAERQHRLRSRSIEIALAQ